MGAEAPSPALRRVVLQFLQSARRPLILSHRDPDPDSLGTALALAGAFDALGARPIVALDRPQSVPGALTDLPGIERLVPLNADLADRTAAGAAPDVVFAVDTAGPHLFGVDTAVLDRLFEGRPVINIDHHVSNQRYGQVNLVEATAAAAAEVLWGLLVEADIPIDAAMATNLQAGLVADTLGFQIADTTARTLRAAAHLVEHGGPTHGVPRRVLNARSFAATRLLGAALAAAHIDDDGRLVWTSVTRDLANAVGANVEDSQGIPNALHDVVGTEVSAVFYETAANQTRVSLRSARWPVNEVAEYFGGGGHELAAGCRLHDPIEAAREKVLARLRTLLPG